MSRDDVEIVERLLEDFIANGPAVVPADFVCDAGTMRGWLDAPIFHGPEGMAEFMDAWREPYDDWSMIVEEVRDAGDGRAVAVCLQRGRPHGSDADVGLRYGVVFTVSGGQARRVQIYVTAEEALEAVGLG